jgi:hypothetical protein
MIGCTGKRTKLTVEVISGTSHNGITVMNEQWIQIIAAAQNGGKPLHIC